MAKRILMHCFRVVCGVVGVAVAASAQPPSRSSEQIKASYDAHKHEFDFLLGDWEITLHNARATDVPPI